MRVWNPRERCIAKGPPGFNSSLGCLWDVCISAGIVSRLSPTLGFKLSFEFFSSCYQVLIGDPKEAKFGTTSEQLLEGYRRCKELGVKRFGLHAMVVSNCGMAASIT